MGLLGAAPSWGQDATAAPEAAPGETALDEPAEEAPAEDQDEAASSEPSDEAAASEGAAPSAPPAPEGAEAAAPPSPAAPPPPDAAFGSEEPPEPSPVGGASPPAVSGGAAPDGAGSAPPPPDGQPAPAAAAQPAQTGPAGWLAGFLGSGDQPKFTLGISGGYALRMNEDDRTHGGSLFGFMDIPLYYGFGVQLEGYGAGWIPSEKAPDPLGLVGASGSLLYAFDDTDAVAWVGVGPTVAAGISNDSGNLEFLPHAGAMFQFGVRFPLGEATRVEVGIRAPYFFYTPDGLNLQLPIGTQQQAQPAGLFPTQVMLTVGLNFEPFSFMDSMKENHDPLRALIPGWLLGVDANAAKKPAPAKPAEGDGQSAPAPSSTPPQK